MLLIKEEGIWMDAIRTLFREYETELNEDLCFQSFEAELANPLQKYGPPKGVLYLAKWNDEVAGCIALMPLPDRISTSLNADTDASTPLSISRSCEMKRLYVRPQFRKHKIGKALVEQLLKDAEQLGYTTMKLDTLQKLQPAIALYKQYGFAETTAYYENPLNAVVYMEKMIG
ncbi:MAG: GNAT family N-acetyltransferase [Chitinophagaceae bacterium]|nr:GNAT family N-acetyltransferase [Chitinophagaceae bacterium]